MPQIGETKRGSELGKTNESSRVYFMWAACVDCGVQRWVALERMGDKVPKYTRCHRCANRTSEKRQKCGVNKLKKGDIAPAWKGGRYVSPDGYVMVYLPEESFFVSMRVQGLYVREHRLVMAQYLNRCLLPWEIVHHKNGIKTDNRLENLELIGCNGRHNTQDKRLIVSLVEENAKLKTRIKELEDACKDKAAR